MADDPWASWNPTSNPSVRGMEAFQARRALSRGMSADPMSPGSASQARPPPGRQPPTGTSSFRQATGTSQPVRRPLPEQSFPASGRGGPSRSGAAGWQRSPPRGHIDHGWASKTGHEEPIAKPEMVGDIESATNAPLTEAQRRDMQTSRRSGREEVQERTKRRPDDERRHLDPSRPSSGEGTRARSRDRNSDRERDRKRSRTDEDRERRRPRERSRSRSRSRDRNRDRDRRGGRKDDERRDRRRDDRDSGRDRRSRSPRRDKHAADIAPSSRDRRDIDDDRRSRPSRAEDMERDDTGTRASILDGKDTEKQEESTNMFSDSLPGVNAVVVSGVREGTTAVDMKTILEGYGQVAYCEEIQASNTQDDTVAFEAAFEDMEDANKAVKELDGILADGSTLKVELLPQEVKQEEQEPTAIRSQHPEMKLKGFATSNSKENSLLSRLGAPMKSTPAPVNGLNKSNGHDDKLPSSLLHPYEDLLSRAGVDSLDTLKRLVRPKSVKEYVEMLCRESPDEQLLQGLTARWALKERLEEWLGEKEPLKMDWKMHS